MTWTPVQMFCAHPNVQAPAVWSKRGRGDNYQSSTMVNTKLKARPPNLVCFSPERRKAVLRPRTYPPLPENGVSSMVNETSADRARQDFQARHTVSRT